MKKAFKRSICLVMTVAFAVAALASCNFSSSPDNEASSGDVGSENKTQSTPSKLTESKPLASVHDNVELLKIYEVEGISSKGSFSYQYFRDAVSGKSVPYRLHVPESIEPDKKYPVILFLHGAGEIGNDNERQLPHFSQSFGIAGDILEESIIVCPQTPSSWSIDETYGDQKGYLSIAKRITDNAIEKYNGDRDRVYVTGLSLGSFATWRILEQYPDFFAAAVPVCGGAGDFASRVMIDTPIWIYHGTADTTVSYTSSSSTFEAIKAAGGKKVKFTTLEGVGHNAWDYAYTDREMFSWMFAQNRKSSSAEYEYISPFEIVTADGKTVISQKDVTCTTYTSSSDGAYLNLTLTDSAQKRLETIYNNNSSTVLSVKIYQKKLYDFKFISVPEKRIKIVRTVDKDLFKSFEKILSK